MDLQAGDQSEDEPLDSLEGRRMRRSMKERT